MSVAPPCIMNNWNSCWVTWSHVWTCSTAPVSPSSHSSHTHTTDHRSAQSVHQSPEQHRTEHRPTEHGSHFTHLTQYSTPCSCFNICTVFSVLPRMHQGGRSQPFMSASYFPFQIPKKRLSRLTELLKTFSFNTHHFAAILTYTLFTLNSRPFITRFSFPNTVFKETSQHIPV